MGLDAEGEGGCCAEAYDFEDDCIEALGAIHRYLEAPE